MHPSHLVWPKSIQISIEIDEPLDSPFSSGPTLSPARRKRKGAAKARRCFSSIAKPHLPPWPRGSMQPGSWSIMAPCLGHTQYVHVYLYIYLLHNNYIYMHLKKKLSGIYIYYTYDLVPPHCVSLLVSTDPALAWISTNENLWSGWINIGLLQNDMPDSKNQPKRDNMLPRVFWVDHFVAAQYVYLYCQWKTTKCFPGQKKYVIQKWAAKMILHPNNVTPKTASKIYFATKWIALTAQAELNFL